jgi:hypothetical protein
MTAAYGIDAFGTAAFGIALATGSFEIEDIFAVSERAIRMTLTYQAGDFSATKGGSVFNPTMYTVTDLTTGVSQVVLGVAMVEDSAMRQFDIVTLQKHSPYPGMMRIAVGSILDDTGRTLGGVRTRDVEGCTTLAGRYGVRQEPADIRNSPVNGTTLDSILSVTPGGDLDTETGSELLKKMILRRLVTSPGEFTHLRNKAFGVGLRVKEIMRVSDLIALRVLVEREVLQEPDVDTVNATVTEDGEGVVAIKVQARRRNSRDLLTFDISSTDFQV